MANWYCTLNEVKTLLGIPLDDDDDDDILGAAIEAACRWIEQLCGQRFWCDEDDVTRYQTAGFADVLFLDEGLVSLTSLETDQDGDGVYETRWAESDYVLRPRHAALDNKPYTFISVASGGRYAFPLLEEGVKLTGKFGYPAVPGEVKQAALLMAARLYKRKDAVFGVMGIPEAGMLRVEGVDQDVMMLLVPYIQMRVGAVWR